MTGAVLFAAYAVVTGLLAPACWHRPAGTGLLAPAALRGRWAARSPRLAMSLWLVLSVSWVVAVVLAVLAATAPFPLAWPGLQPAGQALLAGPVPGGTVAAVAGLLLAAAVVLRAGWCAAGELARSRRDWRQHATLVAATGRPRPELGVVVLDHDAPAVYCMPCGRYRVVVSAGALAALSTEQLQAVLAHERAHLRCRHHHLMLAAAAALARAFPRVPLFAPPQQRQARRACLAATAGLLPPAAIACLPLIIAACDATAHP